MAVTSTFITKAFESAPKLHFILDKPGQLFQELSFMLLSQEAVAQRFSVKMVFLEISQYSQENTCARVSFLIKLQALKQ